MVNVTRIWLDVICATLLCYAISLASLAYQLRALGGSRGVYPIKSFLHRAILSVADESGRSSLAQCIVIVLRLPTVFWFCSTDIFLLGTTWTAALLALFGAMEVLPPFVPLLVAWGIFLSLSTVLSEFVCFPWDLLLLEVGFALLCLLAAGATSDDFPLISRWVLFFLFWRLMFGMGKIKFRPSWRQTPNYIKNFLLWQPLPTPAAAVLYFLPKSIHKMSLWFLFIVEMVLPLCLAAAIILPLPFELGLFLYCGSSPISNCTAISTSHALPHSPGCEAGSSVFAWLRALRLFLGDYD
jgi:hypothetical protein